LTFKQTFKSDAGTFCNRYKSYCTRLMTYYGKISPSSVKVAYAKAKWTISLMGNVQVRTL